MIIIRRKNKVRIHEICRSLNCSAIRTAATHGIIVSIIFLSTSIALVAGSREDWQECPDMNDLERAIPACTRIIKRKGEGVENTGKAYSNRCAARIRQRQFDKAIEDCTQAIKFFPGFALAHRNRCRAYMLNGQYIEAISDCTRGIELDPKSADLFFHRAYSREKIGDNDSALSDYDAAIRLSPDFASAYNNRGDIHLKSGDLDAAIADFDKAIEFDPGNATALMNMGRALSQKDETRATFEQAVAYIDQAVRIKPDDAQLFWRRGNIIANRYRRLAATEDGSNQSDEDGGVDSLFDRAVADFEKAVSLAPKHADAWLGLANLFIAKEDYARAIFNLDMVIRLAPEFISAYMKRADARSASGQHAVAIDDLSQAIKLQSKDSPVRGVIGVRISQAQNGIKIDGVIAGGSAEQAGLSAGEVIEGVDDKSLAGVPTAKAASLISGAPDTKVTLQLRSQDGREREITIERRAQQASANTESGPLYYRRGIAQFAIGQYELAIADFDEASRHGFNSTTTLIARGRAHGRMNKRAKAVDDYFQAVVGSPLWIVPQLRPATPIWELRKPDIESDVASVLGADPNNTAALFINALLRDKSDLSGKIDDYSRIIDLDPTIPTVYELRADVHKQSGQCALAIKDYEHALQQKNIVDNHRTVLLTSITECQFEVGSEMAKLGRHEEAIESFTKGINSGIDVGRTNCGDDGNCQTESVTAEIYLTRAVSNHAVGRRDAAIADCEKAVEIDAQYALKFAQAQVKGDQHDFALILVDKLAVEYPKSANVFYTRGLINIAAGEQDQALADFNTAIDLNPREATYYFRRAMILDAQKQYAQAIDDTNTLIKLAPDFAYGYNMRAWILFETGRAAEGLPDVERALELAPDNAAIVDTRAHIFEALGHTEEAIAEYRRALEINPDQAESREGLERLTKGQQ